MCERKVNGGFRKNNEFGVVYKLGVSREAGQIGRIYITRFTIRNWLIKFWKLANPKSAVWAV